MKGLEVSSTMGSRGVCMSICGANFVHPLPLCNTACSVLTVNIYVV